MPQYGKRVCAHTFFLSLSLDEMIDSLHEVNYVPVWFQLKPVFSIFCFYFLVPAVLFDQLNREQCIHAPFMDPQISLFNNFFIKNGSHDTIHTFKNYFATVFSISIFSFNKNKLNPNGSYMLVRNVRCRT